MREAVRDRGKPPPRLAQKSIVVYGRYFFISPDANTITISLNFFPCEVPFNPLNLLNPRVIYSYESKFKENITVTSEPFFLALKESRKEQKGAERKIWILKNKKISLNLQCVPVVNIRNPCTFP